MKGTVEQLHGFPFTFIFLIVSTIGGRYNIWISRFLATYLITNILTLYLIPCTITLIQKKKT